MGESCCAPAAVVRVARVQPVCRGGAHGQARPSGRTVEETCVDVSETDADGPVVTLSDGTVTLRPWLKGDARFMAAASADPAIRRYNGVLDRLGHPTP